jgi:outer membrane protein assembly factor BamB
MFQHDPGLSGFSDSTAPRTNNLDWTADIYSFFGGFGSPVVVDNKLYIGSSSFGLKNEDSFDLIQTIRGKGKSFKKLDIDYINSFKNKGNIQQSDTGFFTCINATNGSEIWSYYSENFVISTPVVYDGKVFFSSVEDIGWDGNLYCLDSETGEEIWDYSIYTSFYSNPIVADDKLYLASVEYVDEIFKGKMTCFNIQDGDIIWENTLADNEFVYYSTPAFGYDHLYFLTVLEGPQEGGVIYCVDADSGNEIWKKSVVPTLVSPVISDSRVFLSSYNPGIERDVILCLDADDGHEIWHYTMDSDILSGFSSPVVAYDRIFIATTFGFMDYCKIFCFDVENGDLIWSTITPDWMIMSSPAVADEKLYIASNSYIPKLYCINTIDGNIRWIYNLYWENMISPAVANGCLYMADAVFILCFKDGVTMPPSPPSISGSASGKVGIEINYVFKSEDNENDYVYYYIDWDDGNIEEWIGPYNSGESIMLSHKWSVRGNYTIRAKARDDIDGESSWNEIEIKITNPRNKSFDRSVNIFLILKKILQYIILQ